MPPPWFKLPEIWSPRAAHAWTACQQAMWPWAHHSTALDLIFFSKIFVEFIGVTLTKLYRFQVYNSINDVICVLYYVFTTPSQVSFRHHLSHFYPLLPPPPPFPLVITNHHAAVCVYEGFFCRGGSVGFFCLTPSCISPSPSKFPPLWQLSVCSLCLWVCFCLFYLFVLFLRFHISAKSYGVFLSLTGLFHLTEYSPGLSMLLQKGKISFLFTAQ